jgi:hypothetical protein
MGKFLAYALPINDYDLPRWLGGGTFSFNPGPFNIKVRCEIGFWGAGLFGSAAGRPAACLFGRNWSTLEGCLPGHLRWLLGGWMHVK